jgi:hypothetical protein
LHGLFSIHLKAKTSQQVLARLAGLSETTNSVTASLKETKIWWKSDVWELFLSQVSYSRRCAEASAAKAYQKRGLPLATGMEVGYVVTDAAKWELDTERDASEFDAGYYGKH